MPTEKPWLSPAVEGCVLGKAVREMTGGELFVGWMPESLVCAGSLLVAWNLLTSFLACSATFSYVTQ